MLFTIERDLAIHPRPKGRGILALQVKNTLWMALEIMTVDKGVLVVREYAKQRGIMEMVSERLSVVHRVAGEA